MNSRAMPLLAVFAFFLLSCAEVQFGSENTFDQRGCISDVCFDVKRASNVFLNYQIPNGDYEVSEYTRTIADGKSTINRSKSYFTIDGPLIILPSDSGPVSINMANYEFNTSNNQVREKLNNLIGQFGMSKKGSWSSGDTVLVNKYVRLGDGKGFTLKLKIKSHGLVEYEGYNCLYFTANGEAIVEGIHVIINIKSGQNIANSFESYMEDFAEISHAGEKHTWRGISITKVAKK